jgi:hypothetical protein
VVSDEERSEEAERARRLDLFIDSEDDGNAIPSSRLRRRRDVTQGWSGSYYAPPK